MARKSIQIRVDAQLKKRIEKIFNNIGIDTPTAVRIFFMKVDATGGIPFMLQEADEDHYTPAQIRRIDRLAEQAMKGKGLSRPFTDVEEMIAELRK